MKNTKIEWTHHTVNLWHGCTKVHAGCDNCYAEKTSNRWGNQLWGNDSPRRLIKSAMLDLDKYQTEAFNLNERHFVFVGSMMDIFEKPMPLTNNKGEMITMSDADGRCYNLHTDYLRSTLFGWISANQYPNLIFLFLTKRPSNINKYIPEPWLVGPPRNVFFGVSVSDQASAETLIPQLLNVRNAQRFLSVEPQIADIELMHHLQDIHWVIQGGESGHGKRPFDIQWAVKLRQQCHAKNIPYFFKQIDKIKPIPDHLNVREFPIIHLF